jgi:hypothetical protein
MLKTETAIVQNPQDVQARITQHDAVHRRVGADSTQTAWC